jgi:hypothetical protein
MKDVVRVTSCRLEHYFLLDREIALNRQVRHRRRDAAQVDRVVHQRPTLTWREIIRGLVLNAYGPLLRIGSRPSEPKHVDRDAYWSGEEENEKQLRHTWIARHRILLCGEWPNVIPLCVHSQDKLEGRRLARTPLSFHCSEVGPILLVGNCVFLHRCREQGLSLAISV